MIVPSLDLVVVTLAGAMQSQFLPLSDVETYKGRQYFPGSNDTFMQVGDDGGGFGVKGGSFGTSSLEPPSHLRHTMGRQESTYKGEMEPNSDECGAWAAGSE